MTENASSVQRKEITFAEAKEDRRNKLLSQNFKNINADVNSKDRILKGDDLLKPELLTQLMDCLDVKQHGSIKRYSRIEVEIEASELLYNIYSKALCNYLHKDALDTIKKCLCHTTWHFRFLVNIFFILKRACKKEDCSFEQQDVVNVLNHLCLSSNDALTTVIIDLIEDISIRANLDLKILVIDKFSEAVFQKLSTKTDGSYEMIYWTNSIVIRVAAAFKKILRDFPAKKIHTIKNKDIAITVLRSLAGNDWCDTNAKSDSEISLEFLLDRQVEDAVEADEETELLQSPQVNEEGRSTVLRSLAGNDLCDGSAKGDREIPLEFRLDRQAYDAVEGDEETELLQSPHVNEEGRTVQSLIEEFRNLNSGNKKVCELATNFEAQLEKITFSYENHSKLVERDREIRNWNGDDIQTWARRCKERGDWITDPANLPECLAIIKRAAICFWHKDPRHCQILPILLMLQSSCGMLLQILTGEGKSIVCAMLAAVKVLQGFKVDIVTSSSVLAERDARANDGFFSLFGFTCGSNTDSTTETGPKPCYSKDVVYGDSKSFEGDWLRHEHKLYYTRGERGFDNVVVIIDEVDSMLVDENRKQVLLSGRVPGSEYLNPLLIAISFEMNRVLERIVERDGKYVFVDGKKPERNENGQTIVDKDSTINDINGDVLNLVKDHLEIFTTDIVGGRTELKIPDYLKDFVRDQAECWINSALASRCLKENIDYVITPNRAGNMDVTPVDYETTGVVQKDTNWSDCLHQFLQIKHGLKISRSNPVTSYMSNVIYFNKYGNRIYGMSGTLGSRDCQDLLASIYDIEIALIPTNKPKRLQRLDDVVCKTRQEWLENIVNSIKFEAAKRAVLVICETIDNAHAIKDALIPIYNPPDKIRVYDRSDNEQSCEAIEKIVDVGTVIIATNLAGRGTDISKTGEVDKNGGIHVIVTFLPDNLRIEEQAFGRTSRQGTPGSALLIVNAEDSSRKLGMATESCCDVLTLKTIRDLKESAEQEEIKIYEVPRIKLKHELFKKYLNFENELRSSPNFNRFKLAQVEELWGMELQTYWRANVEENREDLNKLKNVTKVYGLKPQSSSKHILNSLYHSVSKAVGELLSAYQIQHVAVAAFLEENYQPQVISEDNGTNAFISRLNQHYLYHSSDITAIQKEIMRKFEDKFCILQPVSNQEYLSLVLENSKNCFSSDNKLGILGIVNINFTHWVCLAVIKSDRGHVVLLKDSFGQKDDRLEEIVNSVFPDVTFVFNEDVEQSHGTSDCGIFALENMRILAMAIETEHQIANASDVNRCRLGEKFGRMPTGVFCSAEKATDLRKNDFADFYVLSVYREICEEELRKRKYSNAKILHRGELKCAMSRIMQLDGFRNVNPIYDEEIIESSIATVGYEFCFVDCDNLSYTYCFRISWSRDLEHSVIEELERFIGENFRLICTNSNERFIKFSTTMEKVEFDENLCTDFVPSIASIFNSLNVSKDSLVLKGEIRQILQNSRLSFVDEESIERDEESSEMKKASDFIVELSKRYNDEKALQLISSVFHLTVVVLRNDREVPDVYKGKDSSGVIYLGLQVATNSSPDKYYCLIQSSEPHFKDINDNIQSAEEINSELHFEYDDTLYGKRQDIEKLIRLLMKEKERESVTFNENKSVEALSHFQQFLDRMKMMYDTDTIMRNPSYLVQESHMLKNGQLLDKARNLDPNFSLAANYSNAQRVIEAKTDDYKSKATEYLNEAVRKIDEVLVPPLEYMCGITSDKNGEFKEQLNNKLDILKQIKGNMQDSLNKISQSGDNKVVIEETKSLKEFFDKDRNLKSEIDELTAIGIPQMFNVAVRKPRGNWFGAIFTACMGFLQIFVGGLCCTAGLHRFGGDLVMYGLNDIYNSLQILSGDKEFDMKQYFTEKAMSIAASLVTIGAENLMEKLELNPPILNQTEKENELVSCKNRLLNMGERFLKNTGIEKLVSAGLGATLKDTKEHFHRKIMDPIKNCLIKDPETSKKMDYLLAVDALCSSKQNNFSIMSYVKDMFEIKRGFLKNILNTVVDTAVYKKGCHPALKASGDAYKAVDSLSALDKVGRMAEEVSTELKKKVNVLHERTSLETVLAVSMGIDTNQASELVAFLRSKQLLDANNDLDESKIQNVTDFGRFSEIKTRVLDKLRQFRDLKSKDHVEVKQKMISQLECHVQDVLLDRMRTDVFGHATGAVSHGISTYLREKMDKMRQEQSIKDKEGAVVFNAMEEDDVVEQSALPVDKLLNEDSRLKKKEKQKLIKVSVKKTFAGDDEMKKAIANYLKETV